MIYPMQKVIDYCIYKGLTTSHRLKLFPSNIGAELEFYGFYDGSYVSIHPSLFSRTGAANVNGIMIKDKLVSTGNNQYTLCAFSALAGLHHNYFVVKNRDTLLQGLKLYVCEDDVEEFISPDPLPLNDEQNTQIKQYVFSKDGKYLVTGSMGLKNNMIIRKMGVKKDYSDFLKIPCTGHNSAITALSCNPQSTIMVSGSSGDRKNIKVWDMSGKLLRTLEGHEGDIVSHIIFSFDGLRLLTVSYSDTTMLSRLMLWNTANVSAIDLVKCLQFDQEDGGSIDLPGRIAMVTFSPLGKNIAALGNFGACLLWDGKSGDYTGATRSVIDAEDMDCFFGLVFSDQEHFCVAFQGGDNPIFTLCDIEGSKNKSQQSMTHIESGPGFSCIAIGITPDMRYLVAKMADDKQIFSQHWALYDDIEAQGFSYIKDKTTSLEKYALYRLLQAGKNKENKIILSKQSPVYSALEKLSHQPSVAHCMNNYLSCYGQTGYEKVSGMVKNFINDLL